MPRYDLDGLRVKFIDDPLGKDRIYLIKDGLACHVPNPDVYRDRFIDGAGVWEIPKLRDLEMGRDVVGGPLVNDNGRVYMPDRCDGFQENCSRHVNDPLTMQRYYLNPKAWGIPSVWPPAAGFGPELRWRPIYSGNRIKTANAPDVYMIDFGKKRHIADPDTYRRLFGGGLPQLIDTVDDIPSSADLDSRTKLIRGASQSQIYLYDGGEKRRVSERAFGYYGFAGGVVQQLSDGDLVEMPDGREIDWPDIYA